MIMKRFSGVLVCGLVLGLMCQVFSGRASADVGGADREYNNNYFGSLSDWQHRLLRNNEEHHLRKAMMQMRSGNAHLFEYVKQDLQYMLIRWPNHPKALQLVTDLAIQTKDPSYAIKWFDKAVDAYPSVYQTHTLYGIYFYRIKKYDKATAEFRAAVKLNPDSSETNYNLGLALFAEHKYKQANRYAQRAYTRGYPLEGLRSQLKDVNAWKPMDEDADQATGSSSSGAASR